MGQIGPRGEIFVGKPAIGDCPHVPEEPSPHSLQSQPPPADHCYTDRRAGKTKTKLKIIPLWLFVGNQPRDSFHYRTSSKPALLGVLLKTEHTSGVLLKPAREMFG